MLIALALLVLPQDVNWPSFRGPRASGIAEGFALPAEFDVPSGRNLAWRTPVAGLAHSSPVVWGGKVFVTTAVKKDAEAELASLFGSANYGAGESVANEGAHAFQLLCLDAASGKVLWTQTAHEGPPAVKRHPKSTHANPSPAADAGHVLAFFGSEGLHCYDHEGRRLWSKSFGVLDSGAPNGTDDTANFQWGFASSPVIHGERVLVQCDVQEGSFVVALAKADGKELWRTPRSEKPTWSTPAIAAHEGREQVICNGYFHTGGYDLASGKELWKLIGGGDVPVPTPLVHEDVVFLTSAHGPSRPLRAILLTAAGEIPAFPAESEHRLWELPNAGIYMQTPLLYGSELYACSDAGVLACHDAATGDTHYRERLGDGSYGFSASAVGGDGKLYFTAESGRVHVVKPGPEFVQLADNDLGETCLATPALSAGRIFFRTRHHLVAVALEDG
jgi:outer membrane protein assembly factor BamB